MAIPTLTPSSTSSKSILPSTGSLNDVTNSELPFGMYATGGSLANEDFVSGAVAQVSYTYRKLGGDILDIELTAQNIYASYEEAVLEYSYILNIHQSKNVLSNYLGNDTGSFDHEGELKDSALSSSLSGTNVSLKYPKMDFGYARRFAEGISDDAGIGGNNRIYSASFAVTGGVQDYDLQSIISQSAATDTGLDFYDKVGNTKIFIRRVFYKTPNAMWRFYGYYGGLGAVGNMSTYGQYADDSTFQVVPPWQNKAQAGSYEDAINTRTSQYSYELKHNRLRVFPIPPDEPNIENMWIEFSIGGNNWEEENNSKIGVDGINNMGTLPFSNIRFESINAIGKQWIRRFALALTKETLGQVRGKFGSLPIPGESVQLNSAELLSQAKEEQLSLREELKTTLDELTYGKLIEGDAALSDAVGGIMVDVPTGIFIG